MSDEAQQLPDFADQTVDACAPTEREPAEGTPKAPISAVVRRGTALSVLWWSENDTSPDAD